MVARPLVSAGLRVLMLERGNWVQRGPHNWAPDGSLMLTPFFSHEAPYQVNSDGKTEMMGYCACVGGPSVFYGAVSMRLRERDFRPAANMVGDSGARWPITYPDLEGYYTRAEEALAVSGEAGVDPTEPMRSTGFPMAPAPLSATSHLIADAARELGLKPFRLPLAINYNTGNDRQKCVACTTCDTFACAIGAKNDLAATVLPQLIDRGLDLRTGTVAVRLVRRGDRVVEIECIEKASGRSVRYAGRLFVLSAGALGSPHLLLTSGLDEVNPAGGHVGRYLMRHCNAIVYGIFRERPDPVGTFHKQLGIHDFYFGHRSIAHPKGKLGTIQQVQTPPAALVEAVAPKPLGRLLRPGVPHLTGLLVIAEDQPQARNRVTIDPRRRDRFGLPQLCITHDYSPRDIAARKALAQKSKAVMRLAGALFCYVHPIKTFSHAVGTVRMGADPASAPLDQYCRYRGLSNLFVVDGSFMPTSAGINPSLTIAANALRVGDHAVRQFDALTRP